MHYSDTVRPSNETALPAIALGGGTIAIWIANLVGLWWVTPLFGFLIGLLPLPGRRSYAVAALAGAVGWGLGLLWLNFQESVGSAASVVAGIMGFGSHGSVVIVLTLLLAAILGLVGAWIGRSLRRVVETRFVDPYGQL
jgi:hypothetical protein